MRETVTKLNPRPGGCKAANVRRSTAHDRVCMTFFDLPKGRNYGISEIGIDKNAKTVFNASPCG
jgi:hypothetical protein